MSVGNLLARLAELERKVAQMMMPATVHERSHEKGVRFKLADGEDGPVLSGWVQPPDNNKGTRSRWLPEVGSQHLVMQFAGASAPSSFVPMSHHDNSANPATEANDTVIYDDGVCRISVLSGALLLKAGESSVRIESGRITATSDLIQNNGDMLRHNSKNVGETHRHEDVVTGSDLTGFPVT